MDKNLRETPANSASHANFSFGDIMAKGEQAVHSAVTTVKEHPYMSALVVAEIGAAAAAAVITHGQSIKNTERLAVLSEVHSKSGLYSDLQNYRHAYGRKLDTDMMKAGLLGVGSFVAAVQFPLASHMNDLSPVRLYQSDSQCLQNSPNKANCGEEERAALKVHEERAMRFATDKQCEDKTGFVCSKEDTAFRPQMSGFVTADSQPHAAFPVYRDNISHGHVSMNGIWLFDTVDKQKILNEQIAALGRNSLSCDMRITHRSDDYPKDHCQV